MKLLTLVLLSTVSYALGYQLSISGWKRKLGRIVDKAKFDEFSAPNFGHNLSNLKLRIEEIFKTITSAEKPSEAFKLSSNSNGTLKEWDAKTIRYKEAKGICGKFS
jgi:hypothetical protein